MPNIADRVIEKCRGRAVVSKITGIGPAGMRREAADPTLRRTAVR